METENEIIDIIKKNLENYKEEYVPGAWENFVRKQKKKKRIIVLKWGTGIAASFLLGWLTFHFYNIMLYSTNDTHERIITTIEKNIKTENKKNAAIINNNDTLDLAGRSLKTSKSTSSGLKSFAETPVIISEVKDGFRISNYVDSPDSNRNISDAAVITELSGKMTDSLKLAYKTDEDSLKSNLVLFTEDLYSEDDDKSGEKRKIRFGISLSPGVNFTETSSSLSISGGLNTSFQLYRNFELSTGILLEQQSVRNYTNKNNPDVPSDKSMANLINFDLPINITWKFFSNRSKSYYISGGISSLAYLSEKYENTIYKQEISEVFVMANGQENIGYEIVTVESNTRNTVSSFQTFDIGGRLNIILGLEQHLSDKIRLHVEPYLRIPVTEMAAENLKFTTSGVTCKISF